MKDSEKVKSSLTGNSDSVTEEEYWSLPLPPAFYAPDLFLKRSLLTI